MLSADSRFKKLSLRKLTDRAKKAKPATRSRRSKHSAGAKTSARFPWLMTPQAVVLGTICLLAGAALIAARQPSSHSSTIASIGAPPDASSPEVNPPTVNPPTAKPAPSRPETRKVVVPQTAARAAVPMRTATVPARKPTAVESVKPSVAETLPATPMPAPAAARSEDERAPTVTITGCLERDEETFWLKNVSGADAPKSRSWKSGFLKKRSSPIELMDPTSALRLRGYVGERIAATGVLTNRELRARSVRRVAGSCN